MRVTAHEQVDYDHLGRWSGLRLYRQAIEAAGLRIEDIRHNTYEFISQRARRASVTYGVKSISLLARKER
jgi:hypothetical protein